MAENLYCGDSKMRNLMNNLGIASFIIGMSFLMMSAVQANDTTATITPAGIEYTKNNDISMDAEVLKLSTKSVEISYTFTNHAENDQTLDVAFPLPLTPVDYNARVFPSWDEAYIAYQLLDSNPHSANSSDPNFSNTNLYSWLREGRAPFINFKRTLNGEERSVNYRIQSLTKDGKDISEILLKNNIPISASFLSGFMEAGKLDKDSELKKKLEKMKLLDDKGHPTWQNQTIYFWQEQFPAKASIKVGHTYTPHAGLHYLYATKKNDDIDFKFYHRDLGEKNWSDFIQTTEMKQFIEELRSEFKKNEGTSASTAASTSSNTSDSVPFPVVELDYILTTGNHWKGPIKKFRLEVTPPTPNAKIAYSSGIKLEKKGNIYYFEAENFRPEKDLKILFVVPDLFQS